MTEEKIHQPTPGSALYTIGYQGRKPEGLLRLAEHLDVVIVDVRAVPHSRVAHWRRPALERLLGARYLWRGDVLGGRYQGRGGPTDEGFAWLRAELGRGRRMALMCMERAPGDCHRFGLITRGRFPEAQHVYLSPAGFDVVIGEDDFARYIDDETMEPACEEIVMEAQP